MTIAVDLGGKARKHTYIHTYIDLVQVVLHLDELIFGSTDRNCLKLYNHLKFTTYETCAIFAQVSYFVHFSQHTTQNSKIDTNAV